MFKQKYINIKLFILNKQFSFQGEVINHALVFTSDNWFINTAISASWGKEMLGVRLPETRMLDLACNVMAHAWQGSV